MAASSMLVLENLNVFYGGIHALRDVSLTVDPGEVVTLIGSNGAGYPGDPGYHSQALRVIERFTRSGPDTLIYEATVDDPQTWVRPWTLRIPLMRGTELHLFEYACHEGNYAMRNILSAARTEDEK